MKNKPQLIIFKRRLLELSETFIKEQALATTKFKPLLVGYKPVNKGLDLTGLNYKFIPNINKLTETICNLFNLPISKVKKFFSAQNTAAIHIHFATQAVKLWPSIKHLNIPVIIMLHGADISIYKEVWESGSKGFTNKFYPQRLLKLAKASNVRFVAVSEAIKKRAIEFGLPENKISVSYIGIDTNKFKPSGLPLLEREKNILFIGRFVEKKAPLLLIEAYQQVLKQVPDAKLNMIGNGPLYEKAVNRAKELDVTVNFLGGLTSLGVAKELAQTRVFCLPSVTAKNGDAEGFGIVVLEAMASGVPVITSAKGGAGEGVIDKVSGICFEENDLEALTQGLITLLQDDTIATQYSEAAIKRVNEHFDNKITIKTLESIYASNSFSNS